MTFALTGVASIVEELSPCHPISRDMRTTFFDDLVVSLDNPEQAARWAGELGVSVEVIRTAMRHAGPLFNDIREELGLARIYVFPRTDIVMQRMLARGALRNR